MRFEDERYVKLYVRNTVTWKMLPWQSKALLPNLMKVVDRAGLLELSGEDPVEAVAALTDFPVEVVSVGMEGLTRRGVVRITPKAIFLPKFLEAQDAPASDKARQEKCRELARDLANAESVLGEPVTKRDRSSQSVTARHEPSQVVTPSHTSHTSYEVVVEEVEHANSKNQPPPPTTPLPTVRAEEGEQQPLVWVEQERYEARDVTGIPVVRSRSKLRWQPTVDGCWEFIQRMRQDLGLQREAKRPPGFNALVASELKAIGPAEVERLVVGYLHDESIRAPGHPSAVLVSEGVWSGRRPDPRSLEVEERGASP